MNKAFFLLLFTLSFSATFTPRISAQQKTGQKPEWKKASAIKLRGALRPERTCFDVIYYSLHLKINPYRQRIGGHNEIWFKVIKPTQTIQIDLFRNMKIEKIVWQGKILKYKRRHNAVFIFFDQSLVPNSIQHIQFYYHGTPTYVNMHYPKGIQWRNDLAGNPWVGVSCEHAGASIWWPNKDHLSDEPDSMRLHLTTPAHLGCIANGKLEKVDAPQNKYRTSHWFVNNPIDNYNVTFNIGNYDVGKYPYKGKDIYCYYLAYDKKEAHAFFKFTPQIVQFFEAVFGEYPFWNDKFAVIQSPYAGMEHQGCLAIGSSLRNNNWYYAHTYPWDATLVHEIAHEWWGNSVSVKDMADAWLQEGFATYAELMFIEFTHNYKMYINEVNEQVKRVNNQKPVVGPRDVNDNTFETGEIYRKGATILHLLRCTINRDDAFFDILKSFATKYKKKMVTTDDFIHWVNQKTKQNYTPFFKQWLYTNKLPTLAYKKEKVSNTEVKYTYWWTNVPKGFKMIAYLRYGNRLVPVVATTTPQSMTLDRNKKVEVLAKNYRNAFVKGKAVAFYRAKRKR